MRFALDALIFAVAFAFPFALARRRARRWGLAVTVTIGDADPRCAARYFSQIAERLDAKPERMRVVVSAPPGMSLDLDRSGALAFTSPGRRRQLLDLRGRWIADHDAPLALDGAVLYVKPADANRFRVATSPEALLPQSDLSRLWLPVAASFACAAGLTWLAPEPFAAVAGWASAACARRFAAWFGRRG